MKKLLSGIGLCICIDIPYAGTASVYRFTVSDSLMTWTERLQNGETEDTVYQRQE